MFVGALIFFFALSVIVPLVFYHTGTKNAKRAKHALIGNLATFCLVVLTASVFIFSGKAYAAEATQAASDLAVAAAYIGAALVTGLCCIGTGIAVSSSATAAIGAISENEKIMGKAVIFVAMAEGIAIYGLLISFMILGRV